MNTEDCRQNSKPNVTGVKANLIKKYKKSVKLLANQPQCVSLEQHEGEKLADFEELCL